MSDRAELVPSNDLTRTRRNFLFVNSILFLVGVVAPATAVDLPGFGKELAIYPPVALCFLIVGSTLFLVEYFLEYRITAIRNNSMVTGRGQATQAESFDSNLKRTITEIGNMRQSLEMRTDKLTAQLERTSEPFLESGPARLSEGIEDALKRFRQSVAITASNAKSEVERVREKD